MKSHLVKILAPVIERLNAKFLNLLGGKSVGVRALVLDSMNRVLLVRHTYRTGWYTPGGGVHNGETPLDGLKRELLEEVGLEISKRPEIFNVYSNRWRGRYDYPILYVVRHFNGEARANDKSEILEVKWFPLDNLPNDCSEKTRLRLLEFTSQELINDAW